jgi:ankyrin repeat protein
LAFVREAVAHPYMNLSIQDDDKKTPLYYAISLCHDEIAQLLMDNAAILSNLSAFYLLPRARKGEFNDKITQLIEHQARNVKFTHK